MKRWIAILFVLLLAGCSKPVDPHSTSVAMDRHADRLPIDDGGGGDPGPGSGGGSGTPTWDGDWRGTLTVMLPGGGASQPCSLHVANYAVTGTYEGVPFAPTTLDSLTTPDENSFIHAHTTLQVSDAVFSCRLDRYWSYGQQSNQMTGWGYAVIGGQQFQLYSWFCNDCTFGGP